MVARMWEGKDKEVRFMIQPPRMFKRGHQPF